MTSTQHAVGDEVTFEGQTWKISKVRRMKAGTWYHLLRRTEEGGWDSTRCKDADLARA